MTTALEPDRLSVPDRLLRMILDNPGEIGPRLVYADWLEDHGIDCARAEFIRVGCELAEIGEPAKSYSSTCYCKSCTDHASHAALLARHNELLEAHPAECPARYIRALTRGSAATECEHGYDVCPKCDGVHPKKCTFTNRSLWFPLLDKLTGPDCPRRNRPGVVHSTGCHECHGTGHLLACDFWAGWPRVVRCRGEDWWGKACIICRYRDNTPASHCSRCRGSSLVGGVGREIMKAWPVTRCEPWDINPRCSASGEWWVYSNGRIFSHVSSIDVSGPIFDLMKGEILSERWSHCEFKTEQAARDALSAACLEWAKQGVSND